MIKVVFPTNEFELAISREEISKFNFFLSKRKKNRLQIGTNSKELWRK